MRNDKLGDRMKNNYENRTRTYLTRRVPVMIRLDGKAFHTFTRGFEKPFDDLFIRAMQETAKFLCENIQGCKLAYTQSDEITLLITDYDTLETDAWFDYNVQKLASVTASMATMFFNKEFAVSYSAKYIAAFDMGEKARLLDTYGVKCHTAMFDARVFNIPKEEVCNAFIWRQKDAMRNSVQMVARTKYSSKELHKKSSTDIINMLKDDYDIDFKKDYSTYKRIGTCVKKVNTADKIGEWMIDYDIPVFTEDRNYIESTLKN